MKKDKTKTKDPVEPVQLEDTNIVEDIFNIDEEEVDIQPGDDYLEHSAEAVGFENREQQWDTYRIIANYIGKGDSVLDFGSGRGDFERFFESEFNETLEYIGIDMNQQLVNAGKKVYNDEVKLICDSWFKLDEEIKQDWSINIGSNNLRYDADTVRDDMAYLQDTIKSMMAHCKKGSVVLLASDQGGIEDGLTNWNAGEVLNWAQKEFGIVAIDHTFSNDIFTLIIYKN